jgi:DNA-binding transcriptional MerR regulator
MAETAANEEQSVAFAISELADEFGITPRAIRYYEECGLLSPERKTPTSQRLYNGRDRARLKLILRGKRFGYSLSEIGDVLKLYDADHTQGKQIVRTLESGLSHVREIDERIEELQEIREEMLEFARSFLEILKTADGAGTPEMKEYISSAAEIIRRMGRTRR